MGIEEENRLIKERIVKLNALREKGVNPYPYSFNIKNHAKEIKDKFNKLAAEKKTEEKVSIAGRIMQIRNMGKAAFAHIQDETGRIQIYFRSDDIGKEKYKLLKKIDIGDILGVHGTVFATKTGEISIYASDFEILTKTLRPLPEKHHGLKDKELRYRMRYLDLIMNQDVKDVFVKRTKMLEAIREFFGKQEGFLEVETPTLQTIYGGANARPFETHINAWDMKMYLSISPELYLKRLIVGGFEKVYTICKNFRNEGVDHSHNPEFTMLECYKSYTDFNEMMRLCEECYKFACKALNNGSTKVKHTYQGKEVEIDFKTPWKRLSMLDAIKKYLEVDVSNMDEKELTQLMRNYNITYEGDFKWGTAVQLIFEEMVEDKLIQPVHIIDHPKESTPLCKAHQKDPRLIERVEPYILGMEIGNGYSELNDPLLQRQLLEEQAKELRGGDDEAHPMDEDFVQAIEYGMTPTGGIGIGIDRMAIILTGTESIRDVILFPTMKPLIDTVEEQDTKLKKEIKESLEE